MSEVVGYLLRPGHLDDLSELGVADAVEKRVRLAVIRLRPLTNLGEARQLLTLLQNEAHVATSPNRQKCPLHDVDMTEQQLQTRVIRLSGGRRVPHPRVGPFHVPNEIAENIAWHPHGRSIPARAAKSLSSRPLRIVQLNLAADFSLPSHQVLLERYHTLTGWSGALAAAGAEVSVVQRFRSAATLVRDGISYTFVEDGAPGLLPPWTVSRPSLNAVAGLAPDVVHVNGLMFPAMWRALRERLGSGCAIVVQDHSGVVPSVLPLLRPLLKRRWSRAFAAIDACSFTARELAERWGVVGLPTDCPVVEIPEASTHLNALDRDEARAQSGVHGTPAILWVGRANPAKDPGTMAAAFQKIFALLPEARLCVVLSAAEDRSMFESLMTTGAPRDRVHIAGPVAHAQMAAYYSAADILLSTSRHEGSGYAVIEAMACGATPCVTDIPSFRVLVGNCGLLWPPGDANACAEAVTKAFSRASNEQRQLVRRHFDNHLSWPVIGQRTFQIYSGVMRQRRSHV
jgi:glycosyltransferase involved in cell wall biosynthesis